MKSDYARYLLNKTKGDYNKIHKQFSITRSHLWPEIERFANLVKGNSRVLDLGCGNGRAYAALKSKNVEYLGIDFSEGLIKEAREHFQLDKAEFKAGNILDLQKNRKFDYVFCIAVLHHIPSKELRKKALENIKMVLEENGLLFITVWNLYQYRYLKYILKFFIFKILGKTKLDFKDVFIPWKLKSNRRVDRYYHAFTKGEMKKLLKEADFKIVDLFYSREGKKNKSFFQTNNLCVITKKD